MINQNAMQVTNAEQYELRNRFGGKRKRLNRQKQERIVPERMNNKENEMRVGIKKGMVVEEEEVEDSEIQSKKVKAASNRLSIVIKPGRFDRSDREPVTGSVRLELKNRLFKTQSNSVKTRA